MGIVRQIARLHMRHRALVERGTMAVDGYGHENPTWATLHASLPCTYWEPSGFEKVDGDIQMVSDQHRLHVPRGTDVTERDRVTSISDRVGNVVATGTFEIRHVTRKPAHLILDLRRVAQ